VPEGFSAGVIYTIVDVYESNDKVFRLSDSEPTPVTPFIPIQESNTTEFEQVSVYFSFIKTTVKFKESGLAFSEQPNLSQDGQLLTGAYLDFEVQKRDIDSNRSFTLGNFYDNTNFGTGTGQWYIKIEKIRDTVPTARGNGSFLLKSVKCYIDGLDEESTETVNCNPDGNIKESVTVMFGETPVSNVFRNNNFKYYNNFYSKAITTEPGLQYYDVYPAPAVSMSPKKLIDIVKMAYKQLYNQRRFYLTGKLYSPNTLLFGKVLTETYTGKKYLMNSCNYDLFFCTFEGEWHEINDSDATTDSMGSFDTSFDTSFD
jgi:hypothetical protein